MAYFRSLTQNQDGSRLYSLQSFIEQFTTAFPEVEINQILIHYFKEKHCICKGKLTGIPTVLTEETVADIRNRMEMSLQSCRFPYWQHKLVLPYKITVVHDWRSQMQYYQDYRTWGTENSHQFVETSLHPLKIGVWVAMSRRQTIGPIFFHHTVNAE